VARLALRCSGSCSQGSGYRGSWIAELFPSPVSASAKCEIGLTWNFERSFTIQAGWDGGSFANTECWNDSGPVVSSLFAEPGLLRTSTPFAIRLLSGLI
jgi:hypothetical protein